MYYIKEFDPWSSGLCTCPPKYSLNPYTGCDHACVYCYITSYIPNAFTPRIKKDLWKKLVKDINKMNKKRIISLSNSSDPYPTIERKMRITRKILKLFLNNNLRYQIITKSDLVVRDIDILEKSRCCIAFTLTSLNENITKKLEPGAPSPKKRIEAMKKLHEKGIPLTVRIDPVIPFINDEEIESVINAVSFVDHVTASTFKPRFDSWKRFTIVFPEISKKLKDQYFNQGEKIGNSWYLPKEIRHDILSKIKTLAEEKGISFGSCREQYYAHPSCDGSHLIP